MKLVELERLALTSDFPEGNSAEDPRLGQIGGPGVGQINQSNHCLILCTLAHSHPPSVILGPLCLHAETAHPRSRVLRS